MARIHPGEFFGNLIMWTGLVIAAVLLAETIRLRRRRGPM
jgi:hypothetical protein